MAAIVTAHAVVLAAVAIQHGHARTAPRSGPTLMTFAVAAPAPEKPASVPKRVAAVIPPPIVVTPSSPPTIQIAYPMMDATEAAAIVAGGCDLTEPVQHALRHDERARSAVLSLPVEARSVANAVMLWDGRWVADGRTEAGRRAIATIRAAILATIASAPEQCRAQEQTGPRLIGVAGPPDMTLALGSGHWRWGDLVADDADASVAVAEGPRTIFHPAGIRRPVRHVADAGQARVVRNRESMDDVQS